jgi:hypothetical protein
MVLLAVTAIRILCKNVRRKILNLASLSMTKASCVKCYTVDFEEEEEFLQYLTLGDIRVAKCQAGHGLRRVTNGLINT